MASHAPEVINSPGSHYSELSEAQKYRDNKELQVSHEKEQVIFVAPDAAKDVETQKNAKTGRRTWPWKWLTGILVVALCMLAVGIGIGYAIGENNGSDSDSIG